MNAFETWLGVLVVLVLVAGVRLRAAWLARAVVATAALGLLTLGALDPDGFVAERNVERYQSTGKIDVVYLQQLSADAVPVVDQLPEPVRSCVLAGDGGRRPAPSGPRRLEPRPEPGRQMLPGTTRCASRWWTA